MGPPCFHGELNGCPPPQQKLGVTKSGGNQFGRPNRLVDQIGRPILDWSTKLVDCRPNWSTKLVDSQPNWSTKKKLVDQLVDQFGVWHLVDQTELVDQLVDQFGRPIWSTGICLPGQANWSTNQLVDQSPFGRPNCLPPGNQIRRQPN